MDKKWLFLFLCLCCMYGCQRDLPKPEVQKVSLKEFLIIPVMAKENPQSFDVRYYVEKDKLYVECLTPNISFRNFSKNQGKILLYVNGEKKEEFFTAAFIVKDLPKGIHRIRLEMVKLNNEPYHLSKEFTINIS